MTSPYGSPAVDAGAAEHALFAAENAQYRAELRARLLPAWYGPVAFVILSANGVGAMVAARHGLALLWPAASLLLILLTLVLSRTARRSSGVVRQRDRRERAIAVGLFLAAVAVCESSGVDTATSVAVIGPVMGALIWARCAWRNAATRRELRELG